MNFLSERYAKVSTYQGMDICTLKSACPADGDELGYKVDNEYFSESIYNHPEDAMKAIDLAIMSGDVTFPKNLDDFNKVWETEYLVARVKRVTDEVQNGNLDRALDILSMLQDKVTAAAREIKDNR